MTNNRLAHLSLFVLVAALLVPGAFAQEKSVDASKSEIAEVATLRAKIEKVRETYKPKIANAEGAEENKKLQVKQEEAIEDVLQSSGEVTPDRYHEIWQAAQSDKKLQKSIMKKLKKERKRLKE